MSIFTWDFIVERLRLDDNLKHIRPKLNARGGFVLYILRDHTSMFINTQNNKFKISLIDTRSSDSYGSISSFDYTPKLFDNVLDVVNAARKLASEVCRIEPPNVELSLPESTIS
jgi:hypothetical protein